MTTRAQTLPKQIKLQHQERNYRSYHQDSRKRTTSKGPLHQEYEEHRGMKTHMGSFGKREALEAQEVNQEAAGILPSHLPA